MDLSVGHIVLFAGASCLVNTCIMRIKSLVSKELVAAIFTGIKGK